MGIFGESVVDEVVCGEGVVSGYMWFCCVRSVCCYVSLGCVFDGYVSGRVVIWYGVGMGGWVWLYDCVRELECEVFDWLW